MKPSMRLRVVGLAGGVEIGRHHRQPHRVRHGDARLVGRPAPQLELAQLGHRAHRRAREQHLGAEAGRDEQLEAGAPRLLLDASGAAAPSRRPPRRGSGTRRRAPAPSSTAPAARRSCRPRRCRRAVRGWMPSKVSSSSPVMPQKYHLHAHRAAGDRLELARPTRASRLAQALPSGATDAMRIVIGSAAARAAATERGQRHERERSAPHRAPRRVGCSCSTSRAVSPLPRARAPRRARAPPASRSCSVCSPAATRRPGVGVMKPEYWPSIHTARRRRRVDEHGAARLRSRRSSTIVGSVPSSSGLSLRVTVS